MAYFKFILFFIFTSFFLFATNYNKGEDRCTSQWKRVNNDTFSTINNVQDRSKKSRVIEFKGAGTKQIYALYTSELASKQGHEYWVSWDMKFSEDFVIILLVQSNLGKHYLIYTPGRLNSYMQYGLGPASTNGKWKTFRRNIQKDIAYFDNRVKIVSLKRFVLKGNGMIGNIQISLGSQTSSLINKVVKNTIPNTQLNQVKKGKIFKAKISSSPIIHMQGKKIVKLKLGESYVEPGVSAYDKEDGEIDVVTMENIYNNEVGRYMVLYMATDSEGNIAIDKRYVDVGDVKIKKETECSDKKKKEMEEEKEEEEAEEYTEEDEEVAQMKAWEKRLALREKELRKKFELREKEFDEKKEKKSNKDWEKHL